METDVKTVKLFCDGSVNPQEKIGFGAYFILYENSDIEYLKQNIKIKKFDNTSSTRLELEVLLWALEDESLQDKNITIYTDCQNILTLKHRQEKLQSRNYYSSSNKLFKNHDLYKQFYKKIEKVSCSFIKIKGHQSSFKKEKLDILFSLVDKASRNELRKNIGQLRI